MLDELAHMEAAPLEAVELWVTAADRSHVQPAKLLKVLEDASARAPHNTRMLAGLAFVQESLGENVKARDYYDRIILVSDRPDERLWAQKQAIRCVCRRTEAASGPFWRAECPQG